MTGRIQTGPPQARDFAPLGKAALNFLVAVWKRTGSFSGVIVPGSLPAMGAALVATGTNLATSYAMQNLVNVFDTVPAGAGGVLPQVQLGEEIVVLNRGANTLAVYPIMSSQIESNGLNNPITLSSGGNARFYLETYTQWRMT